MENKLSPMMSQYKKIKDENPDTLLFFRLGDFYEMFFDDAVIASKELELVLTGRDCGLEEKAPMCGVPFHSVDSYLAKLVSRGYKVAICEQLEDPATAKGIVKRDITRVLTPGTVIESAMLDENKNNYLAVSFYRDKILSLCFTDISTGFVALTCIETKEPLEDMKNEFAKFSPSEVLLDNSTYSLNGVKQFLCSEKSISTELAEDDFFEYISCRKAVEDNIENCLHKLKNNFEKYSVCALGASVKYLSEHQKSQLKNIKDIDFYSGTGYMSLNFSSRRNLELTETMRNREKTGTLLWVLDKTKCSLGKRKIRSWLDKPLTSYTDIMRRQKAVSEIYDDMILCEDIRLNLSRIGDMERMMSRISYGTANAKELRSLCDTLKYIPIIKNCIENCKSEMLRSIYKKTDNLEDVCRLIDEIIADDPPFSVREGEMIKKGYNEELDTLREIQSDSVTYIKNMAQREQERTGIKKLKIGYNRVFGYYIEVTNSFKELVPEDYIRKQTLTNCERYITDELKELESKILGAKEKSVRMEYEIFNSLRLAVAAEYVRISDTADALAQLDAICSLSFVARENNYCPPEILNDGTLNIENGRHPVVEKMLKDSPFVPNDTYFDNQSNRCAIITGPNMAGKSTYMRQVALIVIMAQTGSFVPADKAQVSICDAVFTRVGASDDLASGQSTFMVEMSEVAEMLKKATSNSLIIFDEIGRGTSTYDGMSIARAVLEYTVDKKKLGAKTLFATHYHELTELEDILEGVKNYNIAVKKRGDDITFLRRIVRGGADGSYGVEVAKLAGVPDSVVKRAKIILNDIESLDGGLKPTAGVARYYADNAENDQISFSGGLEKSFIESIKQLDANTLTPIEALTKLYEIINEAKNI